ncbi:uncharacterized protein PV06_01387 [Exophiala oligosperma]|uniref:Uncharacterized protein n=1 Tax=Exophiala oligosperma TaxID=215243 RepID=A0A0D2E204_9EURO|nr:uncharacterized protein PV06_01387 [Exophiala oligosperma]KIW48825.1 hypothetical protein PV06_01387 [Exophiala oligosperma]
MVLPASPSLESQNSTTIDPISPMAERVYAPPGRVSIASQAPEPEPDIDVTTTTTTATTTTTTQACTIQPQEPATVVTAPPPAHVRTNLRGGCDDMDDGCFWCLFCTGMMACFTCCEEYDI